MRVAGIRIHHPTLRNCTFLVTHPGLGSRKAKDYHLRLDANGDTIVSETVWNRLQEARQLGTPHEFIVLNEVTDPPPIVLGLNSAPDNRRMYKQVHDAIREIVPPGVQPRFVQR